MIKPETVYTRCHTQKSEYMLFYKWHHKFEQNMTIFLPYSVLLFVHLLWQKINS